MKLTEKMIEEQILEYLNFLGHFAFKVKDNTQAVDGVHKQTSKWAINGVSDIICILKKGGVLFIEVKRPQGKQSPVQKKFQENIENCKERYFIVRCIGDMKKILDACDEKSWP